MAFFSPSVKYVYIDESGNTSISTDKEGASCFYVPVAVLIDEKDVQDVLLKAENIRKKFFNQGPIKSKSIKQEERRQKVLEDINALPIHFFFMIIDKCLLDKESGLRYRNSFYKFINKQLYAHFLTSYAKLKIFVDTYGDSTFQESFKSYIANKFQPGLFDAPEITYLSDKNSSLIGIADFLSGTIRLILEHKLKQKSTFVKLIKQHAIHGERWPVPKKPLEDRDLLEGFDQLIRDISIHNARTFIEQNLNSPDTYVRMQCATLSAFLKEVSFDADEKEGLYTDELLEHLRVLNFKPISTRVFRQQVIGPLRDSGILISGSSRGYYLATNARDIKQFLEHGSKIIFPMLHRIAKARNTLLDASGGSCDVLSNEMGNMELLNSIIEYLKDQKLGFLTPAEDLEERLYHIEQGENNVSTEKLSK